MCVEESLSVEALLALMLQNMRQKPFGGGGGRIGNILIWKHPGSLKTEHNPPTKKPTNFH